MKYCKGCRTRKDYRHFAPNARLCTDCRAKRVEQRRQYLANWRQQHGAEAQRQWRRRNPSYDKDYYRRKKKASMSMEATTAVFNLAQELTAEEFRLLMFVSEMSGEYRGWLVVEPLRILSRSRLTPRQMARMLYALHCNKVIEMGDTEPARQPLTVEMLGQDLALDSPLHLFIWIRGMPEAETTEADPEA